MCPLGPTAGDCRALPIVPARVQAYRPVARPVDRRRPARPPPNSLTVTSRKPNASTGPARAGPVCKTLTESPGDAGSGLARLDPTHTVAQRADGDGQSRVSGLWPPGRHRME